MPRNRSRSNSVDGFVKVNPKSIKYSDGYYKGQTNINGKRHGEGSLRSLDGSSKCIGTWVDDIICGYGVKEFTLSGDRYEGNFLEGRRHNFGIYRWKNGDNYTGIGLIYFNFY